MRSTLRMMALAGVLSIGGLVLTDDPSTAGMMQFRAPPLSFIGPTNFVKWIADNNAGNGRNHVNFALADEGTVQTRELRGAGREEEHVAASEELLGPARVENGA